jgi:hypothetical protein
MSQAERVGVVVIRVWLEDAHPIRLRARITLTADVAQGETESVVADSPEAILDAVRSYLDVFLGEP